MSPVVNASRSDVTVSPATLLEVPTTPLLQHGAVVRGRVRRKEQGMVLLSEDEFAERSERDVRAIPIGHEHDLGRGKRAPTLVEENARYCLGIIPFHLRRETGGV